MKFHHKCSAEQIIKDKQMRQPRTRTNGDRMLSEALANYHVQSFRQYMTEDANPFATEQGQMSGTSDVPWSGSINMIGTQAGDQAADVGAALAAWERYKKAGLSREQFMRGLRGRAQGEGESWLAGLTPAQKMAMVNAAYTGNEGQGLSDEQIRMLMPGYGIEGNIQAVNRSRSRIRQRQSGDIS